MSHSTNAGPVDAAPERRLIVYAISRADRAVDEYVSFALAALRPHAERIVVALPSGASPENAAQLREVADALVESPYKGFDPAVYPWVVDRESSVRDFDEVVFTGDGWFGPIGDISVAIDRAAMNTAPVRAMVEVPSHLPDDFPDAGYPRRILPWTWTAVRREVILSPAWQGLWRAARASDVSTEREFLDRAAAAGHDVSIVFPAVDYPSHDPAVYTPLQLIDDGYPFLGRTLFTLYPPFLDRFAVIGREIIDGAGIRGYPLELIWQNLARTVPPRGLYAIGGSVEVLSATTSTYDPERPFRIASIIHVGDIDDVPELLDRLAQLPDPYSLYLTTTNGKRAAQLQRLVESRADERIAAFEIRVTPASEGRDMSDFFVGCRDVLLDEGVDLVVKLHTRKMRRKTTNVRRYFRRYQYENLLDSPEHVRNLLALFQREKGLGFVFPPMMHIGYSTMGRGWGGLQDKAAEVAARIGVNVPQDSVSPLAPYGGMFVARPAALRLLTGERWRYRDYGRKGAAQYKHLAHLQERLIVMAGAELGYHARTVLTREHASISHTALESKTDYLFSTTRGWPVEQIQLMQRAGDIGHGGVVALARMYVRLNHPRASHVLMPLFGFALRAILTLRLARRGTQALIAALLGRPWDPDR
ncbi:rhamnan synthesis F family protein [Microbacterium aurum]